MRRVVSAISYTLRALRDHNWHETRGTTVNRGALTFNSLKWTAWHRLALLPLEERVWKRISIGQFRSTIRCAIREKVKRPINVSKWPHLHTGRRLFIFVLFFVPRSYPRGQRESRYFECARGDLMSLNFQFYELIFDMKSRSPMVQRVPIVLENLQLLRLSRVSEILLSIVLLARALQRERWICASVRKRTFTAFRKH